MKYKFAAFARFEFYNKECFQEIDFFILKCRKNRES